ncbi:hypothetical protein J437_LFUL012616 [Ladona fulva]|uniref:Uncharacterized protein n=1 Tax=Ladona fulva TaxID=123851 RepID=A0A8K0P3U0_LADFU|nr:hypothetical protein J437_LFUL012616 [Ladona fulva]
MALPLHLATSLLQQHVTTALQGQQQAAAAAAVAAPATTNYSSVSNTISNNTALMLSHRYYRIWTPNEKDSKHGDLNHIIFDWYLAARAKNFIITGLILQEKAKEMADT